MKTKFIVRVAMSVALLIAVQIALSAISGVELVTVILLCLSFCYGIRTGLAIATTFSLLRCFYFGFDIKIILLYLIYYDIFALFFGWLGRRFDGKVTLLRLGIIVSIAAVFTVMFTMLDNALTVLMFGLRGNAITVYCLQSLTAMVPQTICTLVTVSLLFTPLVRVIRRIHF